MRRWILAVALCTLTVPMAAQAAGGKDLFLANKCNKCHEIKSEGVAPIEAKEGIKDLSGVGKKHDAEWIKKWLMKEVEMEGKKHKFGAWKGTPAELDTIAGWLHGLTK